MDSSTFNPRLIDKIVGVQVCSTTYGMIISEIAHIESEKKHLREQTHRAYEMTVLEYYKSQFDSIYAHLRDKNIWEATHPSLKYPWAEPSGIPSRKY